MAEFAAVFNRSSGIIAFFAVIPAIAIPIRSGAYVEAMGTYLSFRKGSRIYSFLLLAGLQLLLAIVLNIGSIPVMRKLLAKTRLPDKYLSLVYSTGYSVQMVVSPFDGVVNVMILSAGTSFAAYFIHGAGMALVILAGKLFVLDNPAMATALVILLYSFAWTRLLGIPLVELRAAGKEYALALTGFRGISCSRGSLWLPLC